MPDHDHHPPASEIPEYQPSQRFWTPWRMQYVGGEGRGSGCVFCDRLAEDDDVASLILHRGERSFAIMNLFPYNTGHAMILPKDHVATPEALADETAVEMTRFLPRLLAALPEADVEIVETHHRGKKDAPSGTAEALAEVVVRARGDLDEQRIVYGREGIAPRQPGEIGIHSLRGGANSGEHTILLATDGEEIRISHRALSRRTFADGALRAAEWVVKQPPGLYSMADVLAG